MINLIYPCLWFDGKAKEAADYYCSIFKNSQILTETPKVVNFELNGKRFMAINAGPQLRFNDSISFVIDCNTQQEIDYYWDSLSKGGSEGMCGWLKDKYGVSWQVLPTILQKLLDDPQRSYHVTKVFLQMKKIDIEELENA